MSNAKVTQWDGSICGTVGAMLAHSLFPFICTRSVCLHRELSWFWDQEAPLLSLSDLNLPLEKKFDTNSRFKEVEVSGPVVIPLCQNIQPPIEG